jgi:hypothetical protein
MSDPTKSLELINDGRMASLAQEHMSQMIAEMKTRRITELSQNFRSGHIDQATLLSSVAGLCALEDLELEARRKVSRGQIAQKTLEKEQDNGS